MKRIKWVIGFLFLILVVSATAQTFTNYPTLDEPIHYMESYHPVTRVREDQTQAAVLLVLLNLLSPREEIAPEDMVPPEDLRAIGLSEDIYKLLGQGQTDFAIEKFQKEFALPDHPFKELPKQLLATQRRIAENLMGGLDIGNIARLAAISSVHPDPLVRIAAAPLLIVLTDGDDAALEQLRRGTQQKDDRLSQLAATLLARFSPRDSALEQFTRHKQSGFDHDEEVKTTLVIHGTWANGNTWWRNGYQFFEYLEHGVPVDDLFLGDDPFGWSGTWKHKARVKAARELEDWILQHKETCVNIVAHSHGSNVVFVASNNTEFGRMILLSTPSHPHIYSPVNYVSLFSLRVRMDLVVLADGGGNRFPDWTNMREEYFGWFNHSATHDEGRWDSKGVPGWLPNQSCQVP